MEQKYRMLDVGEMLQVGDQVRVEDVWRAIHLDSSGASVKTADRGSYPVGYYRRPITETHIHGSGTYAVDIAAEETIIEVREAWLKDHREMKEKLDAAVAERMDIERMWFGQRAELADVRNQITDLTRRLEYALSDKVIAEARIRDIRKILA